MATGRLYLIRGLPGTGKSTLALNLADGGAVYNIVEADEFFMADGVYRFDASKLAMAHARCRERVYDLFVIFGAAAEISVANTFSRRWEMQPYRDMAKSFGVEVTELTVRTDHTDAELAARSIHGVPAETIAAMRARWEA